MARNLLLMLLRTKGRPENATHVFDDVYLTGNFEALRGAVGNADARFRVFAGHAGWAPGQLDAELARGDWLVVPADADAVFFDADRLWQQLQPPDPAWSAQLLR